MSDLKQNQSELGLDIDAVFNGLPMIDYWHRASHIGKYYTVSTNISIANGVTGAFYLRTPASATNGIVHGQFQVTVNGSLSATLYEDVTASVSGTSLSFNNFNRIVAGLGVSSDMSAAITPTVSAAAFGVALANKQVASGNALNNWDSPEFIFKPSTNYMLHIANNNAATENVNIQFRAYQTIKF